LNFQALPGSRAFAENRRMRYLRDRQRKVRGQHEPDPAIAGFRGVVHLGAASQGEHFQTGRACLVGMDVLALIEGDLCDGAQHQGRGDWQFEQWPGQSHQAADCT